VAEGLSRTMLLPTRTAYVETSVGATQAAGAYARAEVGLRPVEPVGLFGFGQVDRFGWQAGAGARLVLKF